MRDELLAKLGPIFRGHGVQLAYLFGSQAQGRAGPLSDFDFGVLFRETLSPSERFHQRLSLITELIGALHAQHIDVVVLNEAPPAIRFKIIEHGQIIYNEDERARVCFEAQTMSEYFDTKPLRELYRRRLFEAVITGKLYD